MSNTPPIEQSIGLDVEAKLKQVNPTASVLVTPIYAKHKDIQKLQLRVLYMDACDFTVRYTDFGTFIVINLGLKGFRTKDVTKTFVVDNIYTEDFPDRIASAFIPLVELKNDPGLLRHTLMEMELSLEDNDLYSEFDPSGKTYIFKASKHLEQLIANFI